MITFFKRVPGCDEVSRNHKKMQIHYNSEHKMYDYMGMLAKETEKENKKNTARKCKRVKKVQKDVKTKECSVPPCDDQDEDMTEQRLQLIIEKSVEKVVEWLEFSYYQDVCRNPSCKKSYCPNVYPAKPNLFSTVGDGGRYEGAVCLPKYIFIIS